MSKIDRGVCEHESVEVVTVWSNKNGTRNYFRDDGDHPADKLKLDSRVSTKTISDNKVGSIT